MNHLIRRKTTPPLLITIALFCLGLLPKAQATPETALPNFNTADGQNALASVTTGAANTAVGWFSLFSNTDGSFNTAVGAGTLLFNVGDQTTGAGVENTATGTAALLFNTTGAFNTAVGATALSNNTEGFFNTAIGRRALFSNTDGIFNTANGAGALERNTAGNGNTANGVSALFSNTIGNGNTATGLSALERNTTGAGNTANGDRVLFSNTTGDGNTAIGGEALENNTTGDFNIALGFNSGGNLTSGSHNIHIGNVGVAGESNTIRIGQGGLQAKIFMAAIRGVTTGNADAINVVIDSNGQLGTMSSSRRFKKEIKSMDSASEVIHRLKPVTFHYKSDNKGTPQFGLIAEEVAEVNPALVVSDEEGKLYSVRYDQVNAMLLNEFLKEHRKVQDLEARIAQQQKRFESKLVEQERQIDALASILQKVSAQIEMSKPALQTVLNNQVKQ
jgi:Chaperone of endosialidase